MSLSPRSSLRVISALLVVLFGAAAAPAPLYEVYQAQWGFSTTTLTLVFAVYVLTLLVTLLTVGSLSDHVGRRPVMGATLLLAAVASVLFLAAGGVTALVLARAVQGVAVGLTSGSLVAALLDLRPQGNTTALISSVAPPGGLAIGALATSALVQYAPLPTRLVWSLLLGFGPAFSGAYRTVIASAPEPDRAALIAAAYTISYAAFGIPALLAGIAASSYGLRDTALVYAAAVAALAGGALTALITGRRHEAAVAAVAVAPPPGPCTIPPCVPADVADPVSEAVTA